MNRQQRLRDIRKRATRLRRRWQMKDFYGEPLVLAAILMAPEDIEWLLYEVDRLETELRRERQDKALDEMARDAAAMELYEKGEGGG